MLLQVFSFQSLNTFIYLFIVFLFFDSNECGDFVFKSNRTTEEREKEKQAASAHQKGKKPTEDLDQQHQKEKNMENYHHQQRQWHVYGEHSYMQWDILIIPLWIDTSSDARPPALAISTHLRTSQRATPGTVTTRTTTSPMRKTGGLNFPGCWLYIWAVRRLSAGASMLFQLWFHILHSNCLNNFFHLMFSHVFCFS